MISPDTLKTVIQTVYDLGRELGNTETEQWQLGEVDLDEYDDNQEITLTNGTLRNAMAESAEVAREAILEQLRMARHNCSPLYADGLDHALDLISGKLN